MASIFRIVLRDPSRHDTYATREFDLPLGTTFPIGRASSNASKKKLMAAPHNAYIDSPVVSRQHAVLSANSDAGVPDVYISDQGSMHGTMLNGQRLLPYTSTKLSYGDELQFGTDVNRNEESFVARTYVFESQISRPFCPGFTVPDPESEEEDIAERRGSLTDPFVIRSSSPSSGQSEEDEQAEVTLIMDHVLSQEEPPKLHIPAPHTPSDAEADGGLESDFDSEAGSVDYPEMESESEAEIQDSEDEDLEQDCPAHMTEPASTTAPPISSHRYVYSSDDAPAQEYLPRVDAYNSDGTTQPQECLPQVSLLGPQHYVNHPMPSMNASSLGNVSSNEDAAPPLPPRPTVRPAYWNDSFPMFGPNFDNYMGTFGERPSLFIPESPAAPEFMHSRTPMASFCGYPGGQMFQADRLPSPPPMPTSDVESAVPLQPGRRTKVSIEEIVEEQPRTPESVSSLKRKADVLEDEEPVAISDEVLEKAAVAIEQAPVNAIVAVPIHDAATTQAAAAIAQRPKKTPRSVLNRVLNKAAYPLLGATGAVVSFALLSTLPDTFFV